MNPKRMRKHAQFYTINELSTLYDVTPRTLRHYEDVGLLAPIRQGARRLYRARDRVRLQLILRGRRLGFGLPEIQEMLDLYDADPTEVAQLRDVIRRGDAKLEELRTHVDELQTMMAEITALRETMQRRLDRILDQED